MTDLIETIGIALMLVLLVPVLALAIVLLVIYAIIMGIVVMTCFTVAYCVDSICKCFRKSS